MTSAFQRTPDEDPNIQRANWLGRYLDVERVYDSKLSEVLADAAKGIDESFAATVGERNFSQTVERAQLALAHKAIRTKVNQIFGKTKDIIGDGQQDAAVAAVNANLYTERSILAGMFSNTTDRNQYADSLRQTARRRIESVMTRVLETEKPLSSRVYDTKALASGMVSRTINRALARGDSWEKLAKDVSSLIDPSVPGGVSYAVKRLARTEINNAFHAQSIHDAQEQPWVTGMEWNLSKRHEKDDCECETYALQKTFPIDKVPEKPHPHCRCYVTPVQQDYESFENSLVSGQFDAYIESQIPGMERDIDSGGSYSMSGGLPPSEEPLKLKGDSDIDAIMGMLGIPDDKPINKEPLKIPPPPDPKPIVGVPKGYERYYEAMKKVSLQEPDFMMPTDLALHYAEYDRASMESAQETLATLEKVIREAGAIKNPIRISTDGERALVHEGNHRIAVAKKLGYQHVPVIVDFNDEVIQNEGNDPVELEPFMRKFLEDLPNQDGEEKKPATIIEEGFSKIVEPVDVKWDGKPIAISLFDTPYSERREMSYDEKRDHDEIVQDMFNAWSSIGFDVEKQDMREGARIAMQKGYSGFDDELRYEAIHFGDDAARFGNAAVEAVEKKISPDDAQESGMAKRSPDLLEEYGKQIFAMMVHQPILEGEETGVFRGVTLTPDHIEKLVEGQVISMPLSSFGAFGEDYGTGFANGKNWVSKDHPKDGVPVIFELLAGARTADLGDGELVTAGQFKITDIGVSEESDVIKVRLQHISLKEADLDKKTRGSYSKTGEDSDISFVGEPPESGYGKPRSKTDQKKVATQRKRIEKVLPEARVVGFDPHIDPQIAKSYADTIVKLQAKYPFAAKMLKAIGFGDDKLASYNGHTAPGDPAFALRKTNGRYSELLKINTIRSDDLDKEGGWIDRNKIDVRNGFHPKISDEDPIAFTVTHEFAHVMNYMFDNPRFDISRTDILNMAGDAYVEDTPESQRSRDGFIKYIIDNVPGYGMLAGYQGQASKDPADINPHELIPEAFASVETGNGNTLEKKIHEAFVSLYDQHYGKAK